MDNTEKDLKHINNCFTCAMGEVKKIQHVTRDYSSLIEKEYENCSLYFVKRYLEMFKSDICNDNIGAKLEELNLLWIHAHKVFENYYKQETE